MLSVQAKQLVEHQFAQRAREHWARGRCMVASPRSRASAVVASTLRSIWCMQISSWALALSNRHTSPSGLSGWRIRHFIPHTRSPVSVTREDVKWGDGFFILTALGASRGSYVPLGTLHHMLSSWIVLGEASEDTPNVADDTITACGAHARSLQRTAIRRRYWEGAHRYDGNQKRFNL